VEAFARNCKWAASAQYRVSLQRVSHAIRHGLSSHCGGHPPACMRAWLLPASRAKIVLNLKVRALEGTRHWQLWVFGGISGPCLSRSHMCTSLQGSSDSMRPWYVCCHGLLPSVTFPTFLPPPPHIHTRYCDAGTLLHCRSPDLGP
jgi:hypothetical protein